MKLNYSNYLNADHKQDCITLNMASAGIPVASVIVLVR